MSKEEKKYRFLLIHAFHLPKDGRYALHMTHDETLSKERRLMNYDEVKHLLEDVEWDLHPGPQAPYGDWPVENREEFCLAAAARLPIIREACESRKYNAIVLLGGGDPGFLEAREIARQYHMPVTANAFSQMHIASMLGNKFSVIDLAESLNMFYYNLVVQYHFSQRCASIRNINYPLPRPGYTGEPFISEEREKVMRGEPSNVVDIAVREAVSAIEEDGAEVIIFGCSAAYWLRPVVEKRLNEIGWEVPVLEGYSCSITLAKTMVSLGIDASGLLFPSDRPKKWRRKKIF
jgi:Asp/Glu/hydantoin racemase